MTGDLELRRSVQSYPGRVPLGRNGVVAPVCVGRAGLAFLFHIRDFTAGRYLPIATDNAPAGERGEPEQPDETHNALAIAS